MRRGYGVIIHRVKRQRIKRGFILLGLKATMDLRGSKSPLSMVYIIAYTCVKEQRVDGYALYILNLK